MCENKSALMLYAVDVSSRDNLAEGTEWPFQEKKKKNEMKYTFIFQKYACK